MFVYKATLVVCLLAVLVCSSNGNLCKPLFVQQPHTAFSCNPYQHAPKLECRVSGVVSSTHKLTWHTTAQHKDAFTAIQMHRQSNGCYSMTSTLQLAEPLVNHIGQHWCVLTTPNRTSILKSSSFSLHSPAHYTHKPACRHRDHSNSQQQRQHQLIARGTAETNSSGDGGQNKTISGGVIAGVVIVVVMVAVGGVIILSVLIFGCMYRHRKQLLKDDNSDKETAFNNNIEESNNSNSINYISYSEIESMASNTLNKVEKNDEKVNSNSGAYQALATNTRDYLSVYTMLGERDRIGGERDRIGRDRLGEGRDRIAEADSLPRTHTGSMERRKRGFPIRKPEQNVRVTIKPKEVVRNPSAHRIRHTHTTLTRDDSQLIEED